MILAFDIGTTAVKATLFGEGLAAVAGESVEYRLLAPGGSRVELEPETYWSGMRDCVGRLLARRPGAARELRGIGVTTQGETLIPVDAAGRPLRNAIVWLDGRAAAEAARIRERWDKAEFYARTGIPDCNGLCPVSKLLWIKEREPDVYRRTRAFLLLEDYILFRLTGRLASEKSLLSTTGYFDIAADRPWEGMLDSIGVDPALLPEALECGSPVGELLPGAAAELGLRPGVAVATGAMDQAAGAIGAGNASPGLVSETTGTALAVALTCERPDFRHPARPTLYRHAIAGKYLYIPICMTAGMALKWFKDEFCPDLAAAAASRGVSPYDLIGELVESTAPGANGLVLLPNLAGTTQPDDNPAARGVFLGVGLDTGRAHFARAIFEGVAFMLRENLELVEAAGGTRAAEIRSLGGGARSAAWSRIKADVTGRRIVAMAEPECASLGAAILVATALGRYPSIEAAAAASNRAAASFEPDPARAAPYEAAYARYKRLYERTRDLFQE